MEYHILDDEHLEVLAGDIAKGYWKLADSAITRDGDKSVNLMNNLKSVTVRIKQKVSTLDSMSDVPVGQVIGMALGVVLGPFGGFANKALGMATGQHEFVCIGCDLGDGRKFIARMRSTVFEKVRKFSAVVNEKK